MVTPDPWDIGRDNECLQIEAPISFDDERSFDADESFDGGMRIRGEHDDHLSYREHFKKEVLKKSSTYFNGYCYRLIDFEISASKHTLSFGDRDTQAS